MALNAMLHSAPAGRHLCQLHKDSAGLAESVGEFVAAGLKRGERVIVIAVPEHADLIIERMRADDWNVESFRATDQLAILDARLTLGQFMSAAGLPDWDAFRATILPILKRVPGLASATRAYGEMVNVLWQDGNVSAAVALEEYWNRLAREASFALFCCYVVDGLSDGCYGDPLHEIGRTHTDVLMTEDDVRFQAAVDAASREILGSTISLTLSLSGREESAGEHRLPGGQRSVLWLRRNMPALSGRILERARYHFDTSTPRVL